jgi:hypothetical protein
MMSSTKFKVLAGVGGAAALVGLTAAPAFAFGVDTGSEAITSPVSIPALTVVGPSITLTNDANGNPVLDFTITGTGYDTAGGSVTAMVCDGVPETSPKWKIGIDCDAETATSQLAVGLNDNTGAEIPNGGIVFPLGDPDAAIVLFRGKGPNDQFNCLAPNDDPSATQVSVPNAGPNATLAPIDPNVPSWGSNLPLVAGVGGGTAPCQIRVAYSNTSEDTSSDHEFPIVLAQDAVTGPPTSVPESPLTVALPIGGVVLFGAAGALLYRKRRSAAA